ncbi:MAG: alpha/beta fold hydrolase [Acidimicrobiales bacterium]
MTIGTADRTIAVNGVELAVDDRNPDSPAIPLVLVHGFTGARIDWTDVIDDLARDRRVVAWTHRGHGDSTNTADPSSYTFEQLKDDMVAVTDELGLGRFHLLGHSMGGIVSQRYVLTHAERVASLVLMDTLGEPSDGLPRAWIDQIVATGRTEGMGRVGELMAQFAGEDPAIADRVRWKHSNMDVEAFDALGTELTLFPSMLDELGSTVSVPTTVLVGENDIPLLSFADALHGAVAHSELVVIPDAAHSPQEENTDAWLGAVRNHLERAERMEGTDEAEGLDGTEGTEEAERPGV